jgi:ureidoacrylate peracid hydrolase
MIPNLVRLAAAARSSGVKIYMVQSTLDERYLTPAMRYRKMRIGRSKDICQENTWGQRQIEDLQPYPGDVVVTKHTFSAFHGTELAQMLADGAIETLIVTGVTTEVCVETSVRNIACLPFYNVIPDDCTASDDSQNHLAALRRMDKFFGTVTKSDDLFVVG